MIDAKELTDTRQFIEGLLNSSEPEIKALTTGITWLIRDYVAKQNHHLLDVYQLFIARYGKHPEVLYRLAQIYLYGVYVAPNQSEYNKYRQQLQECAHPGLYFLMAYEAFHNTFAIKYEALSDQKRLTAVRIALARVAGYAPAAIVFACKVINHQFIQRNSLQQQLIPAYEVLLQTSKNTVVSEYMTALCNYYGFGTAQNFVLADMHLNSAAKRGFRPAQILQQTFGLMSNHTQQLDKIKKKPHKPIDYEIFNTNLDMRIFARNFHRHVPSAAKRIWLRENENSVETISQKVDMQLLCEVNISDEIINDLIYLARNADFSAMEKTVSFFQTYKFENSRLNLAIWYILKIVFEMKDINEQQLKFCNLVNDIMQVAIDLAKNNQEFNESIAVFCYALLLKFSNDDCDEKSMLSIALALIYGVGVPRNQSAGLASLISLADKENEEAITALTELQFKLKNYAHGITLKLRLLGENFIKAPENYLCIEDKNAQYRLGQICLYAKDNNFTQEHFLQFCKKAQMLGHSYTDYLKGFSYLNGVYQDIDGHKAMLFFEKAAGLGYAPAKVLLAELYLINYPVGKWQYKKAIKLLLDNKDQYPLASYVLSKYQDDKNDEYLIQAAEGGCCIAMYHLGKKKIELASDNGANSQALLTQGIELIRASTQMRNFLHENIILADNQIMDEIMLNYKNYSDALPGLNLVGHLYLSDGELDQAEDIFQELLDNPLSSKKNKDEARAELEIIKREKQKMLDEAKVNLQITCNSYLKLNTAMQTLSNKLQTIQRNNKKNQKNIHTQENNAHLINDILAKLIDWKNEEFETIDSDNIAEILEKTTQIKQAYIALEKMFNMGITCLFPGIKDKKLEAKLDYLEQISIKKMRSYLLFNHAKPVVFEGLDTPIVPENGMLLNSCT